MKSPQQEKIEEIILKHIGSVNSFVDESGHNHFEECAKEIADTLLVVAPTPS